MISTRTHTHTVQEAHMHTYTDKHIHRHTGVHYAVHVHPGANWYTDTNTHMDKQLQFPHMY